MSSVCLPAGRAGGPAVAHHGMELWLVDLTGGPQDLARAEREVTSEERARAGRGRADVRRRRLLLRAELRRILAVELGVAPVQVPISTTTTGRPRVAGRPDLDVNCSASHEWGLVALARGRRVGVDIERVAAWSDDVLEEAWLTPRERRALGRMPWAARGLAATRSWTQKEAVLKGRGSGLFEPPSSVVTRIGALAGMVTGWRIEDVPVPSGWVASIATAPMTEALG